MTVLTVAIRPARCVVVPEAEMVVTVFVLSGAELARLPHQNIAVPGKYYTATMHCVRSKMTFGQAQGDYNSLTEAEAAADNQANEIARRLEDRTQRHLLDKQMGRVIGKTRQ